MNGQSAWLIYHPQNSGLIFALSPVYKANDKIATLKGELHISKIEKTKRFIRTEEQSGKTIVSYNRFTQVCFVAIWIIASYLLGLQ